MESQDEKFQKSKGSVIHLPVPLTATPLKHGLSSKIILEYFWKNAILKAFLMLPHLSKKDILLDSPDVTQYCLQTSLKIDIQDIDIDIFM